MWHFCYFKPNTAMSQSATLYRVSQEMFEELSKSENKQKFNINSVKSYSIFQGSFMGLEYILSKGQDNSTIELVSEIFNPKAILGRQNFEKLTPEEQFEFYKSGLLIPYLPASTITRLNDFLSEIPESDIRLKYDSSELNDNGIYPEVWQNDNSPDLAYTEQHIVKDFKEIKKIIKQANTECDYIFVFIG